MSIKVVGPTYSGSRRWLRWHLPWGQEQWRCTLCVHCHRPLLDSVHPSISPSAWPSASGPAFRRTTSYWSARTDRWCRVRLGRWWCPAPGIHRCWSNAEAEVDSRWRSTDGGECQVMEELRPMNCRSSGTTTSPTLRVINILLRHAKTL